MSDGALTKEEIDSLLYDSKKRDFERRKQNILNDIKNLGILGMDAVGGHLSLDAIESVIKIIKRDKELLDKNAGESG
jgi:hypothetical protein